MIKPSTLLDVHPKEWNTIMLPKDTNVYQYRNLLHFKNHVKTLTQRNDDYCKVSYKDALSQLLKNTPQITEGNYQIIKNKVKQNLLKRGLITENIYESYKYSIEGQIWDVAKVIAEDPACFLVPNETYISHFYELYISVSYPWYVENSDVMENIAKILATVELLEQQHIYCKLSLVLPIHNVTAAITHLKSVGKPNYMAIIPLFSHKDDKSIDTMSAILNDRLLRKFFFAVLEDTYKKDLLDNYGNVVDLPFTIKPVGLNEVDLCSSILDKVIN